MILPVCPQEERVGRSGGAGPSSHAAQEAREAGLANLAGAENVFPQGVLQKTGKAGGKSWLQNHTSQIRNVSVTI